MFLMPTKLFGHPDEKIAIMSVRANAGAAEMVVFEVSLEAFPSVGYSPDFQLIKGLVQIS
jgi:hypothetical protein